MKQTGRFLIYGATGFTGKLTARTAKERGLKPILAGRDRAKLTAFADLLSFQCCAFELSDPHAIDAALGEVDVVLHIAGPFSATSKPMTDACLRTGTHYLDITGEIDVFEELAARDAEAKMAGVMLMPGVGFDVVPSDCLAAHLKQRLPDAIDLKIDIGGLNAVSHGTMESMVESIPNGARVRRDGRIITVSRPRETSCDFGEGPVSTLVLPWGDVSTAYYSTGIKNIEVRMAVTPPLRIAMSLPRFARKIFGMPFVQSFLKAQIARMPEGPSDEVLRTGRRVLVGVVTNANGENARARVTTGQGNVLTAQAGVEIARRVIAGEVKLGFQTPSLVYGPDFILQFEGATREELK